MRHAAVVNSDFVWLHVVDAARLDGPFRQIEFSKASGAKDAS